MRGAGLRATTARRAVLAALVGHDGHASAEELAAIVRRDHPEVHLSTVYRALESFARVGITTHVHLGHGRAVHHLTDPGGLHHHAVCDRCGTVVDLPADVFDDVRARLEAELGFSADPHHFALVGTCRRCRDDRADAPAAGSTDAVSVER